MILDAGKKAVPRNQRAIQDETQWPQTDQVFDLPDVSFDNHQWVQQGYTLIDNCPNCLKQAISIPYGRMLVKEGGKYKLVDEVK